MRVHFILAISLFFSCKTYKTDLPTSNCSVNYKNDPYSRESKVKATLNEILKTGVPGVSVAIYSNEGWWHHAAGYAKLEDQTPMQSCHLNYLQSITKLYTAVAVMKLAEEGKISINDPITVYLPSISDYVERASEITVKMLMNHTSGIPEYNSNPYYTTQLLQDPTKDWTPWKYMEIIKGKQLMFKPSSRYWYCNTNYEILALIADKVSGDHASYIDVGILNPLGITETYYRNDPEYLKYQEVFNGYWDRYSNGILENISTLQRQNVSDMIGDDGIVSTPHDAVAFLKGLFEGRIIGLESLDLMMEWQKNQKGEKTYGLGLDLGDFQGNKGMGHSGGGLGAGCQLYYFPEKNICFFIGVNLSTVTESPIHLKLEPLLNQLHDQILN